MAKNLYKMVQVGNSWDDIPKYFDCFLVAGGSEYRAYEILRKANKQKIKIDSVLLFDFQERKKGITSNDQTMYNEYKTFKFSIKEVHCSIKDPSACIKSFRKNGIDLSSYKNIAIDITSFSKPYFFLILKHLQALDNISSVTVFYTEPKSYLFMKGLYNSYQSSFGPLRILEIPGYTGSETSGQTRLLVILLGFDGDLSKEIDEDVAPKETITVNGFPGYSLKFKDISLISNEKIITKGKAIRYSRANNPFETYNLLDKLKECKDFENDFINIAPLGTKPMALGACMFALHNPDVRVVYPVPENYINVTTDKCWESWAYKIPLVSTN